MQAATLLPIGSPSIVGERVVGYKITAVLLAALLLTSMSLASGTASAATLAHPCNGKSQERIVANYNRGATIVPLRCGSPTYGFRHIEERGRWSATFSSKIALTISRGQQSRDRSIYSLFNSDCIELFRVVVNHGPFRGRGFRPQGVITAYERTYPTHTRTSIDDYAVVPRECPIYVPIGHALG